MLFRESKNSLFPCESVYGNIEVKSYLSKTELETSIMNVASVKKLVRAQSDMCDILPFRRFGIGEGLTYNPQPGNPYLGFIFSYDGLVAPSVAELLNQYLRDRTLPAEQLPNFVFSYQRGYLVLRVKEQDQQLVPASLNEGFTGYAVIEAGKDTLPLFFLTLNICLNQIILKAPDFNSYWVQVVDEVAKRN